TNRSRVRADVMPMPESRRSGMNAFQPMLQGGQRRMARKIDLQGSHRNITLGDGLEVGAGPGILLRPGGSDPVNGPAARIVRGQDGLRAVAKPEPRAAKALERREGHIGHVDIENERRLERALDQLPDELLRDLC